MRASEKFGGLASRTDGPDEFAREGCDAGMFVSMSEGRRIWHGVVECPKCKAAMKETRQMHLHHVDVFMECPDCKTRVPPRCTCHGMAEALRSKPSALKQAGWGGLAQ